jgi:hypothetical protein
MLQLAFNAQGSRLIMVVVQLRAVKTYVAAVEALRKRERQDETHFPIIIDGFLSFIPRWMLTCFFARFCWISPLCMTKLRVLVLCFSYFTDNSNILHPSKECFFWLNFCYSVTKTNPAEPIQKIFVKVPKNVPKSERKKNSEIVIFNTIGSS